MDMNKQAIEKIEELVNRGNEVEVVEIGGKQYCEKNLTRYDKIEMASPLKVSTLSAIVDYLVSLSCEYEGQKMILHVESPKKVELLTELNVERNREKLLESTAIVSEFDFDTWYNQERFMIELQSNFIKNEDLEKILAFSGNIEKCNDETYSDDGVMQTATIKTGIVSKDVVEVPNPVELTLYRTFQEVPQPSSKFVFRVGDKDVPAFKLVEAQGNIWRNEAIGNIKEYLMRELTSRCEEKLISEKLLHSISVIG